MKFFIKNKKSIYFVFYCFFIKNLYASSFLDKKNKSDECEFIITVENNYINYKRSLLILDYKIKEDIKLEGELNFDVYIEKTRERFNLKNILVKLKNVGWFNLKIENCPHSYHQTHSFYLYQYDI